MGILLLCLFYWMSVSLVKSMVQRNHHLLLMLTLCFHPMMYSWSGQSLWKNSCIKPLMWSKQLKHLERDQNDYGRRWFIMIPRLKSRHPKRGRKQKTSNLSARRFQFLSLWKSGCAVPFDSYESIRIIGQPISILWWACGQTSFCCYCLHFRFALLCLIATQCMFYICSSPLSSHRDWRVSLCRLFLSAPYNRMRLTTDSINVITLYATCVHGWVISDKLALQ